MGTDPGHPTAKKVLQRRDLGGVRVASRRGLRPSPDVAIRGVTNMGRHPKSSLNVVAPKASSVPNSKV